MRPMRCFVGPHRFVNFCVMTQPNATFGGAHPGSYDKQNSNSAEIFVQCTYPQVSPSSACLEVVVLTNKQTNRSRWKHPTLFATLQRWVITAIKMLTLYMFALLLSEQLTATTFIQHATVTRRQETDKIPLDTIPPGHNPPGHNPPGYNPQDTIPLDTIPRLHCVYWQCFACLNQTVKRRDFVRHF